MRTEKSKDHGCVFLLMRKLKLMLSSTAELSAVIYMPGIDSLVCGPNELSLDDKPQSSVNMEAHTTN